MKDLLDALIQAREIIRKKVNVNISDNEIHIKLKNINDIINKYKI